ncbi:hypothetical protein NLI96_g3955 [Meripilus lineatus]|uniref:Uncharacterized protein n=1 Tax=Meripilus lineatus TaxID=2056292 RepID=A0AAD5V5I6_9APHY|nr:hypothetical protein NLI96_g3955 [Physisporinus lineatus]
MQQCQILILGEAGMCGLSFDLKLEDGLCDCGAGVGTRALCCRFAANFFPEDYDPVIEDLYEKQVSVNGEDVNIQLYDVAGQEEYFPLHDYHAQRSEGFLLAYSITSRTSFERIRELHHTILRNKPGEADIPVVLLANKCDLTRDRQVPAIEGEILARKMGWHFFETSAKTKTNVDEAFVELVARVRQSQKVEEPPTPTPPPLSPSPPPPQPIEEPAEEVGVPGCRICVIM